MAVYRHIHINYWQDGFVLDLTPEEKYFYIYLMSNSKTSQCGIYELPKRIIETEMGYNRETVEKLLKRFEEYEKIYYCERTREVFIRNWIKHNRANSPKVKKCIQKELESVKCREFVDMFINSCKEYGYSIDIVSKDYPYSIDSVSIEYGEKEKEKEKQKEKQKQKEKLRNQNLDSEDFCDEEVLEKSVCDISRYKTLYEQNVGLINPIVGEWLFEVAETYDYDLFKRAIEIATDKGRCNKGYINGILNQWRCNNIFTVSDLKAFEVGLKNKEERNGTYRGEYSKSQYARAFEKEDEGLYRKPTEEELEAIRREFGE